MAYKFSSNELLYKSKNTESSPVLPPTKSKMAYASPLRQAGSQMVQFPNNSMNIPSINEFVSPMETNPSMFSSRFRHRNNTNKSSIFLPFTGDVRDDPDYQLKIGRRRLAGSRLVYQSTDGILGTYSSREDQLKREQKQKLITLNRIISQQSQKVLGFGEFEEKPEIFSVESLREEVKEAEKSRQSERQVEDFFRKFRNARLYLDGIEASRTNQKSFDRIFNQERYEAMTKRLANNPERVKSYKEAVLRRIKAFTSPEIDRRQKELMRILEEERMGQNVQRETKRGNIF